MQHRLAADRRQGQVQDVRGGPLRSRVRPVHDRLRDQGFDLRPQPHLERPQVRVLRVVRCRRQQAGDARRVFRAGAEGLFLAAADLSGGQAAAGTHDEGADPLGGMDLVAGQGVRIRPALPHVKGHPQKALHPVHMEMGSGGFLLDERGNFFQRLDRPGFIVHLHTADQRCPVGQQPFQRLQVHQAPVVIRHFHRLQTADWTGLLYSRMLSRAEQHLAAPGLARPAKDDQVVRLRAAGEEHSLAPHGRVNSFQNGIPAVPHSLLRRQSGSVQSGRVVKLLPHTCRHRFHRLGTHPCGGAVVKVNRHR